MQSAQSHLLSKQNNLSLNTQLHQQPSQQKLHHKQLTNIYCQPCFKRGLINQPVYVNLNQFQNNRYICESCSFGQTYIVQLNRNFKKDIDKYVKVQSLKQTKSNYQHFNKDKQFIYKNTQFINNKHQQKQKLTDKGIKQISEQFVNQNDQTYNVQQLPKQSSQTSSNQQLFIPQFMKNIQINHNDYTKYSTSDIGTYTQKIIKQYTDASKAIDRYQEMIANHIMKWRNKLKIQFEGVIGTFGNSIVVQFSQELKKLQILSNHLKVLQTQLKQGDLNNFQEQRESAILQLTKLNSQNQSIISSIKYQKPFKKSPEQLYHQTLRKYNKQKQKVQVFVQILKMSGTRNLSNLGPLYTCCKGFSQAVQILVNLQTTQTNRRFDFISQKLKLCSIEALYDAEMINNGLIDNKIESPPIFEVSNEIFGRQKQKIQNFMIRKKRPSKVRAFEKGLGKCFTQLPVKIKQQQKNIEISLVSSQSDRQQLKQSVNRQLLLQDQQPSQFNESQQKLQVTNAILQQQAQKFQKIKMAKLRSKKPFDSALLNQHKINRDEAKQYNKYKPIMYQSNQINLQQCMNENQNQSNQTNNQISPFPGMQQYYAYDKGRNIYQAKLQINSQNYHNFPPPQVYLGSVQSLTIKFCPPTTQPCQLLKATKSCFKKLIQLIIQDPKLATKQMIIMIAEYFPKLKSLVIKCNHQFDWEVGKYFQRKMTGLIRFQVNDGKNID